MADKKISELTTTSEIKNEDNIELSQNTGNGLVSLKATILALATKILTAINFTSALTTTEKTIIGAINEVAEGGGGGGTGGHTIIDENGNSMTARAGLQFVGGANVSDDFTNNKTIVDLASAGGIDGVFIDTSNVIVQQSAVGQSPKTYTATEDCIMWVYLVINNTNASVSVDGNIVFYASSLISQNAGQTGLIPLKKGQTATITVSNYSDSQYTVYGIQTGTTHSKFQPVIYSFEEREIGVWTDGKPLYVKTYNVTFSSNYTDITIDSTHEVKLLDGGIDSNSNDKFIHLRYATQSELVGAYEYEAGKIRFQNYYYDSRPNGWLNVYYTKSTDTAGSGNWTPQGVPTHHYSTDEQVIGTWVDGKTLYEKTLISNAQVSLNDSAWTTIPMPNDAVPTGLDTKFIVNSFNPNDSNLLQDNRTRYIYDNGAIKGASSQNGQNVPAGLTLVLRYTKS